VTPNVLVLGNLFVDDLVFADGQTRMAQAGGAALYSALAARVWGARTGCVSVVGTDYPTEMLDALERAGVDLGGVHRLERTGVRAWLLYEEGARHLVHRLGCPTHEDVSPGPGHIPAAWHAPQAVHVAPMPFTVQCELLRSLSTGARPFVSVDPHRPITSDTLPDWRAALADADAFFPGEDELVIDGAHDDVSAVLPRLAAGRLRFVVFKRGPKGGLLFDAHEGRFHTWTARAPDVTDPTGAGDAFALGFVTGHLEGLPVEACLNRAIVTASFALESWGPDALLKASRDEAVRRLQEWYGHGGGS
jgi:sugar/nucleoside kinase (ribokinase family)